MGFASTHTEAIVHLRERRDSYRKEKSKGGVGTTNRGRDRGQVGGRWRRRLEGGWRGVGCGNHEGGVFQATP